MEGLCSTILADPPYSTILADPPWQVLNKTGKTAPKRLFQYPTMALQEITALPVAKLAAARAHLYLWVPNARLQEGLHVMKTWGFIYRSNLVWYKIRKDGGPDRRGGGWNFCNVTELVLFGVRGKMRTLAPGRTQPNLFPTYRQAPYSRRPDELYDLIEACSPGPYFELFARFRRTGWDQIGSIDWRTQCQILPEINNTEKTQKKTIAKELGGKRIGIFGKEDVVFHLFGEEWYGEIKSRTTLALDKWWDQLIKAKSEQSANLMLFVHKKHRSIKDNTYVVMKLKTLLDLEQEVMSVMRRTYLTSEEVMSEISKAEHICEAEKFEEEYLNRRLKEWNS